MLKLGTETGSLTNHLMSRMTIGAPEPVVGMGATLLSWTDRNAATVVEVWKQGASEFIALTDDDATLVGGSCMSESQTYEYTPRPEGYRTTFRRRPGGTWEAVRKSDSGRWVKAEGPGLLLGRRETYRDPSF